MKLPFYLIDSFSEKPFSGNPTPVLPTGVPLPEHRMKAFAAEMNLPVTVFAQRETQGRWLLRYFTVKEEIPACGHASLAAASLIFEEEKTNEICFLTVAGIELTARLGEQDFFLDYPRYEPRPYSPNGTLFEALGISSFTSVFFCQELECLFIELEDPAVLKSLSPDFRALMSSDPALKEVVVTSQADRPQWNYLLRSFCPWIGIDEDPVTGSVHSVLAPFWAGRLNTSTLIAHQASARGGELYLRTFPDRVGIGGKCFRLVEGTVNF